MSEREYKKFEEMFKKNKNLTIFFIKLKNFINFDGYDRKEFLRCRDVKFENGYVFFKVENWAKFKDEELKIHFNDIDVLVPSNDKKSSKLPIFLRDIDFKEGFRTL